MEVADAVVVVNEGRIEQVGTPRELYEHPRNEFVMSFVGPVNRLGESFVRPHDVELLAAGDAAGAAGPSAGEAMVERIAHLGFEVRVELLLAGGERIWAQATRDRVAELELRVGDVVGVRIAQPRVFSA